MHRDNQEKNFSQQKMAKALFGLMKNKPVSEIGDYEIIKSAHVSSKTFYRYFKNKIDLLDHIEDFYLKGFAASLKEDHDAFTKAEEASRKDRKVYYHSTIDFWIKNTAAIKLLLSENGDIRFLLKLREAAFKEYVFITKYKFGYRYDLSPGSNNYFASQIFISVVFAALMTWMQEPTRISRQKLVQFIDQIMNDHRLLHQLNIQHKPHT